MPKTSPEQLLRLLFPPMLARLAGEPPADANDWSFERKYDGFRAVAALAGGELALWSRNRIDLAARWFRRLRQGSRDRGRRVSGNNFEVVVKVLRARGTPEVGSRFGAADAGGSFSEMDTTGKIINTMSRILIDAGVLAFELEDRDLPMEDRAVLSQAISRISGEAQTVVCWLLDTPLDTPRQ